MSAITTTITDANAELPDHPDGEMWPLVMLWDADKQTCADTATELLDALFIGQNYAAQDDVDAFAMRLDHALAFADYLQGVELDAFATRDPDAATAIMDDDLGLTIMSRSKNRVLEDHLFGEHGWSGNVPSLVVVKQFYTEAGVPVPHGDRVLVLDVERENDYLDSLAKAGLIELMKAV